ncbi:AsmA family protein [Thermopetrobacter sp. TC1]|uniref:AsmA family protein n=1 Tax=Thermopetrobacter sp. TC1 TaxID=1495045 RepID=UPI000571855F|nr:AsmA family protein [Thermopetrobacter sp. TC1]
MARTRKKRRKRRASRALRRLTVFLLLFIILFAGLLFAGRVLLSADFFRQQIISAVASQTGRTLKIGDAQVAFWPTLTLRLHDVALSDPPWMNGGRGVFLRMKTLDLAVALKPLLQRRLQVKRIDFKGPEVFLRVDEKGRANWDFSAPQEPAKGTASGTADKENRQKEPSVTSNVGGFLSEIRLAPVRISKGRVHFTDARSASRFDADDVNLVISLPRPDAPLSLKGDLIWRQRPVHIALFLKAPDRLTTAGSAISASVSAPEIKAAYEGLLRIQNGLVLAGRIEARGPSLRNLLAWAGAPLSPGRGLGTFAVKGAVDSAGNRITLKKARITLDGMHAQGTLRIDLSGARPSIAASLGVDRIDTNVYLAPAAKAGKATAGKAGGKNDKRPRGAGGDWADAPIDFSPLKAVDAHLLLATNAILWKNVRIGASTVEARLKGGRLDATLKKMAFYGGQATGRIILNGARRTPAVQIALRANGIDGEAFLRDFADIRRIRGRLFIDASLAAAGRSQREMISTLRGSARITFRDGAIRGINIARLVRTVKTAIINGWQKAPKEKTDFAELSAAFRIQDGIAVTDSLKLLGPLVRLKGRGEIDLLRRRLDLRIEPKIVASLKGQGGREELEGLPVPIIVRGPWDDPRIYPDIEGILRDPEGAYRRLKSLIGKVTGGKGVKPIEAIEKKARKTVKKQREKLKQKATRELEKVIGEDKAKKAVDKVEKKARKLLKDLFR